MRRTTLKLLCFFLISAKGEIFFRIRQEIIGKTRTKGRSFGHVDERRISQLLVNKIK